MKFKIALMVAAMTAAMSAQANDVSTGVGGALGGAGGAAIGNHVGGTTGAVIGGAAGGSGRRRGRRHRQRQDGRGDRRRDRGRRRRRGRQQSRRHQRRDHRRRRRRRRRCGRRRVDDRGFRRSPQTTAGAQPKVQPVGMATAPAHPEGVSCNRNNPGKGRALGHCKHVDDDASHLGRGRSSDRPFHFQRAKRDDRRRTKIVAAAPRRCARAAGALQSDLHLETPRRPSDSQNSDLALRCRLWHTRC